MKKVFLIFLGLSLVFTIIASSFSSQLLANPDDDDDEVIEWNSVGQEFI